MSSGGWVRIEVSYFSHPRTLAAGPSGRAAHLASICWVGEHLTDGRIPAAAVRSILNAAEAPRHTPELLVACGLWLPAEGGYELSGYLDRNPSRAQIEARLQRDRERKAGRPASGRSPNGSGPESAGTPEATARHGT